MAIWSDAELLGYLKDFGQPVTIGTAENYSIIWAVPDVDPVEALEVESVSRTLRARASDVAGVVRGTAVTAAEDESYSVLRVRPRNDGLADLDLVAYGQAKSSSSGGGDDEPPPTPPKPGEEWPDSEVVETPEGD